MLTSNSAETGGVEGLLLTQVAMYVFIFDSELTKYVQTSSSLTQGSWTLQYMYSSSLTQGSWTLAFSLSVVEMRPGLCVPGRLYLNSPECQWLCDDSLTRRPRSSAAVSPAPPVIIQILTLMTFKLLNDCTVQHRINTKLGPQSWLEIFISLESPFP